MARREEIHIRLVLIAPPRGVDFGIQRGRGAEFEVMFVQRSGGDDLTFEFPLALGDNTKDRSPNFQGPFAQGPPAGRFIYIDVGTYAGQQGTPWSRRMKIPLQGITGALVRKAMSKPGSVLLARIPGTGKDGGPSCATVKLLGDWQVTQTSINEGGHPC